MDPSSGRSPIRSRRQLLDALYARRRPDARRAVHAIPDMTRFGVMKHLGVLEQAHLVVTERHGRSKHHYLNPVPIRQIHDRWISKYAEPFTERAGRARRQLERPATA